MISSEFFVKVLNKKIYVGVDDEIYHSFVEYLIKVSQNQTSRKDIIFRKENSVNEVLKSSIKYSAKEANTIPVAFFNAFGNGTQKNCIYNLSDPEYYMVPMILIIGLRMNKRVDERIMDEMYYSLKRMRIDYLIIDFFTEEKTIIKRLKEFERSLCDGSKVAFFIKDPVFE